MQRRHQDGTGRGCGTNLEQTEDLDKLITEESKDRNDLDVEDSWNYLNRAVIRRGEDRIGYEARRKTKKSWFTEQMLNKMEERTWKNVS